MTLKKRIHHQPPDKALVDALQNAKLMMDNLNDEIRRNPKRVLSKLVSELRKEENKAGPILKFGLLLDQKVDISTAVPLLSSFLEKAQPPAVRSSASTVLARHYMQINDQDEIRKILKRNDSPVSNAALLTLVRHDGEPGYLSPYVKAVLPLIHGETAELALFVINAAAEQGSADAQSFMKFFFRKPPQA